jgi:transcriptional regulator GlxA family with amidase domain
MDRRVEFMLVLMQDHYCQALTLRKMSQAVHLTREHFCRLFKAETGTTPAKYVKSLRLQKGRELLESTLMSVKEITHVVGVNDESHFVRDFKLAYGLTPMQHRSKSVRPKRSGISEPFKPHIKLR